MGRLVNGRIFDCNNIRSTYEFTGAFNTNVTKASSVWVTAMFVQLTALATCAIMWVIDGRPDIMKLFKVDNKITLLGGVIGAFITFTVIKSISGLGIAKAEVTIVAAQIIVSYLLDFWIVWK